MTKLTTQQRKQLRETFERVIFKKSGAIECRRGFFYTHGYTSEKFCQKVVETFTALGFRVLIIESYEHWATWPRESYWTVTVKVLEPITVAA